MSAVLAILGLWRGRAGWLGLGLVVALAALASLLGLMAGSGALLAASGGALAIVSVLRVLGPARVVLRYAERLVTHAALFRALADLRVWFFRGLAARAAGGLGFRRPGDMLSRLVNDVEALDGLYLRILVPLAGAALLLPLLTWLSARLDIHLGLAVGVLFATAAILLPALAARLSAGSGDRLAAAAAGLRISALDAIAGLREVRAYGAEDRMLGVVRARQEALLDTQATLAHRASLVAAGAFLCGQATLLMLLAGAGLRPGLAVVTVFVSVAAFEAIAPLPRAGIIAGHAAAAARRVLDAASGPLSLPDPAAPAACSAGSALRFEGIRFRWAGDRAPVFDGLSLDVPQGTRVALLGPSGAGKSSLAALAMKAVAPEMGRVLLGGVDLARLRAEDVRSRVALLGQATHLFDDTIRNNLLLGRADVSEAALWAALDKAAIGDVVRALPDGLDSWVGEGGARFSGGQGRRLALARTLLSDAPVLILDEPCAGLDADIERAFLTTLNDAAAGRTLILITHRLTGVERLDRIWRLSGGHAVAAMA